MGNQLRRLVGDPGELERLGVQRQLSGVDLGEIENIVDDVQQRTRRGTDDPDEHALAVIQRGRLQQLRHADHPVHRGADFMAHIRQEFGFCPLGAPGDFALDHQIGVIIPQPLKRQQQGDRRYADGEQRQPDDPQTEDQISFMERR
jgi:hypothetical protein